MTTATWILSLVLVGVGAFKLGMLWMEKIAAELLAALVYNGMLDSSFRNLTEEDMRIMSQKYLASKKREHHEA